MGFFAFFGRANFRRNISAVGRNDDINISYAFINTIYTFISISSIDTMNSIKYGTQLSPFYIVICIKYDCKIVIFIDSYYKSYNFILCIVIPVQTTNNNNPFDMYSNYTQVMFMAMLDINIRYSQLVILYYSYTVYVYSVYLQAI